MSGQRDKSDTTRSADPASSRRSLAVWIWTALVIADAVLVTRRFSVGFASALPGSLALLSTVLVAAASWIAWILSGTSQSQPPHPQPAPRQSIARRLIPQGLTIGVTLVWGWSISATASPLMGGLLSAVILLQVVAVVGDGFEDRVRFTAPRLTDSASGSVGSNSDGAGGMPIGTNNVTFGDATPVAQFPDHRVTDRSLSGASSATVTADESPEDEHGESDSVAESDEDLTLWLSRRLTDDGELIEGWVRVHFSPGQRETVVHVAFCPPLAGAAGIETEDLDGVGLEIRVAAVFPFGTRLSVRRCGSLTEGETDRVGFIAHATAANRAA